MIRKISLLCILFSLFLLATGCGAKKASTLKHAPAPVFPQIIAVVPVANNVADPLISRIVRQKAIDGLFFKGYHKIEARVIDERLARVYGNMDFTGESISPMVIGSLTGADGVLYCSLREMKTSFRFMSAVTSVELSFDIRRTETGETVWQATQKASERNFGFTRRQLENKSFISYEAVIDEIFQKVMGKIPEGSDML